MRMADGTTPTGMALTGTLGGIRVLEFPADAAHRDFRGPNDEPQNDQLDIGYSPHLALFEGSFL